MAKSGKTRRWGQADPRADLYGRVLQRVGSALSGAGATEGSLELRGLSAAELALIQAYLQDDFSWLSGWQAAAEEALLLQRRAVRHTAAGVGRSWLDKPRPLRCAQCGARVCLLRGSAVRPCVCCGSALFRAS